MHRLNRNVLANLLRLSLLLLFTAGLYSWQLLPTTVQAQTRPTLDPSRQPLTALPIATVRAALTATAAAPTATVRPPTAVPTVVSTATAAPSSTPPLPSLGSGKGGPNYPLLLGGVVLFWLIGFSILRLATRRR
jgi:hypothetical protein